MRTNRLKIRLPFAGAALATAIALLGSTAFAVDNFWLGVDTDWNNAANWSLGRVPVNPNGQPSGDTFDDAIINLDTGNYPYVTVDNSVSPRDVMIGRGAGNSGRVDQVSGTLHYGTNGGWFYLGRTGGTGVYNLADVTTTGSGVTGFGKGSGSLTGGGNLWIGGTDWEAGGGVGTMNVNTTGTVTANGNLAVAGGGSTVGTLNIEAGTVNATGEFWVGNGGGQGTLNLAGTASINSNSWVCVGRGGGNGTVTMTGGTWTKTGGGNFIVGDNSVGHMTQNAGALTVNNEVWVGQAGSANGTYTFNGGTIANNSWVAIGRDGGTGQFTMTGGTWTKSGESNFIVGASGPGTMNISGGLVEVVPGGAADRGITWVAETNNCTGTLTLSGSGEFRSRSIIVGVNGGTNGTLNLNGGTVRTSQMVGGNGTATVNFNGTQVIATGLSTTFVNNFDTANINAGGLLVDSNGHTLTAPQALAGTGGVVKTGGGTLTLTGPNTYAGPTLVNSGKLGVTTSALNTGDVTVADGAAFGITQTVADSVYHAANVTFGSTLTTRLDFDLGNLAGNTANAPLAVSGTLTLNGTGIVINVADQMPAVGTVPLVSYPVGQKAGSAGFVLGTLPNGVVATLVDDGAVGSVYLNVTSVSLPKWKGTADDATPNGTWDIATTANWTDQVSGNPTTYADGAPVLFDDSAPDAGTTAVTLDAAVAPGSVKFNNFTDVYSLSGTGKITGSTSLLKQGGASVTISTLNDYTGSTTIEATDDPATPEVVAVGGKLSVNSIANGGVPSAIGASSADAANLVLKGGTLEYTGPAATSDRGFTIAATGSVISTVGDLTLGGPVVTTTGNLVKTGAGNLTLTNPGANVFGTVNQGLRVNGGTLTLDGGVAGTQTNAVAGELWLGATPDVSASLVLNNTSLTTTSWLAMGRGNGSATTTLTATNSRITTANFSTGYNAGLANDSDQNITLTNTTWTNNGVTLLAESVNSTTTMVIEGTSVYNARGRFSIGLGDNSLATVTLRGSAQLIQSNNGWVSIGNGGALGTGILNIQDNAVASFSDVDFNVSDVGTSRGTINISGSGKLTTAGTVYIGKGTGTSGAVNISGGSFTGSRSVLIANGSGSTGAVTMTGGTFAGGGVNEFQIGARGQGTWNQSAGTANAAGWVSIGRYGGSTGVANITGGTFNQTGTGNMLLVGEEGTGTLTISGTGAVNSAGSALVISNAAAAVGTVNLDGGTLTARQVIAGAGGAGNGTLNFNGGLLVAGANANPTFVSNLDAATVKAGGARIDSNGQTIAINQALLDGGGGGGLTKSGAGTLTLNATNTYTGPTTVAAGVLAVNGSIATSSLTTVDAGATLRGTGTLGSTAVADVGHVAPGNSIGTLTISGSMTINGTLDVEYDDSLAGQKIDLLAVSGDLDISAATVDFADISAGPVGLSGIAYIFATYGTLTGSQFASVVDLPTGYTIDYAYSGNNIALIPEPTAALLGALGLLGLLRRRRV